MGFFACIYYSALRPEEATSLRGRNLELAGGGAWGWMTLETASPETDQHWSEAGQRHSDRALKHRAVGDIRRARPSRARTHPAPATKR